MIRCSLSRLRQRCLCQDGWLVPLEECVSNEAANGGENFAACHLHSASGGGGNKMHGCATFPAMPVRFFLSLAMEEPFSQSAPSFHLEGWLLLCPSLTFKKKVIYGGRNRLQRLRPALHMATPEDEVREALSLIETAGLPYPSDLLLLNFVSDARHRHLAARYVQRAFAAGEAGLLVTDWTYIIDSSELSPRSLYRLRGGSRGT